MLGIDDRSTITKPFDECCKRYAVRIVRPSRQQEVSLLQPILTKDTGSSKGSTEDDTYANEEMALTKYQDGSERELGPAPERNA